MTSAVGEDASALERLAGQFRDLVRAMVDWERGLGLESVVHYARSAVPGAEHASITYLGRNQVRPETIAATDELPIRVDVLQYSLDEGPCVAALTVNDLVKVDDLAGDDQFPRFAPRAVELGVRSMLSGRLFLSESQRGALNLYSSRPGAFEPDQLAIAAIFASYTSLLLLNRMHEDKVMRLERALESNREIGVAIGILMAQNRWTQSEAFARLVQASQGLNRKLREIAEDVNRTRSLPDAR